jgi:hypothetical protein
LSPIRDGPAIAVFIPFASNLSDKGGFGAKDCIALAHPIIRTSGCAFFEPKMTPEEGFRSVVASGIYTPEGKLAKEYGG